MSDHFVDAEYQKKHHHDIMGGTPHISDEDEYRHEEHKGRHELLSDVQFEDTYPTAVSKEQAQTLPGSFYGAINSSEQ
jgi:hypothetical protein